MAQLNAQLKKGYGLIVEPSYDEMLGAVRTPLRVPIPDRRAKQVALGVYRNLILETSRKYHDYEHAVLDYYRSGARAPLRAAQIQERDDDHFGYVRDYNDAMDEQEAEEFAYQAFVEEQQAQEAEQRRRELAGAHGSNLMYPEIELQHEDLVEAGVSHTMPAPRPQPPRGQYTRPAQQFISTGVPQPRTLPTQEELNYGARGRRRMRLIAGTGADLGWDIERRRDSAGRFTTDPSFSQRSSTNVAAPSLLSDASRR